ncbi:hypothetical protein K7432_016603 [Basidiobolus ranarum]|uniref:F-box domain-containing protein n=1 Tax=Basidiobolus ranarum TaxID=34480 RepID=A0ABR2WEH1_9FUNG
MINQYPFECIKFARSEAIGGLTYFMDEPILEAAEDRFKYSSDYDWLIRSPLVNPVDLPTYQRAPLSSAAIESPLFSLPVNILNMIFVNLEIHELASLQEVSRALLQAVRLSGITITKCNVTKIHN